MITDDVIDKLSDLLSDEFKEVFSLRKEIDKKNDSPVNYVVISQESPNEVIPGNFSYELDMTVMLVADVTGEIAPSVRAYVDELTQALLSFQAQVNKVDGDQPDFWLGNVLVYWCQAGLPATAASSEKLEVQIPLRLTINY